MNILKSLVDSAGDLLGTSKLSQLNKSVFRPTIGTGITRQEYNLCNGSDLFEVPSENDQKIIKNQSDLERRNAANQLLAAIVENGTSFSEDRITEFSSTIPSTPGTNPVGVAVIRQMSTAGRSRLQHKFDRKIV